MSLATPMYLSEGRGCVSGFVWLRTGLADAACSGPCPTNYVCHEGSTSPLLNAEEYRLSNTHAT